LKQFYSSRHLFFLVDVDAPGQPFIMHPDMAISKGFWPGTGIVRPGSPPASRGLAQDHGENPGRPDGHGGPARKRTAPQALLFPGRQAIERAARRRCCAKKEANPKEDSAYFKALTKRFRASNWQLGGLSGSITDVRLLAPEKTAFDASRKASFIQSLDRELRRYTGLSSRHDTFQWKKLLRCEHCHISCIDLHLSAGSGPRRYLLMYAAFQEEFDRRHPL